MRVADAQGQWDAASRYLNTATYGLPPRDAWAELESALDDWRAGRTSWEHWCDSTERARAAWARLHGVRPEAVAVGATVSELVGLVAASVPDGAEVLAPEGDFTSLLFPFAVQERRGVTVRTVPLGGLAGAVGPGTGVVAFSAVQSSTGEVADLDAVAAAAADVGALTVVDSTQASSWLPLDASRFDAVACAGYKWLLSPRGTAYLYVGERLAERLVPLHAGWYAGDEFPGTYYGLPLRLHDSARRFDTSPAWFSWVGAAPAVELLERIGAEAIGGHDVALADRLRRGLGLPEAGSAIVSAEVPGAEQKLARAGIRAATRAGSLRVSFHLYNTEADVDAALEALAG